MPCVCEGVGGGGGSIAFKGGGACLPPLAFSMAPLALLLPLLPQKLTERKLAKVNAGEHDVFI